MRTILRCRSCGFLTELSSRTNEIDDELEDQLGNIPCDRL
ncbi:MAG: dual CXXC motif small (seleno)protein [Desulfovibrionales bacterium]